MNIGIYIYPQAEVLDFSGPFEVFATAARVSDTQELINTFLISERGGAVKARAGYQVITEYSLNEHPKLDVLVVVGGVHNDEMENPNTINWIAEQAKQVSLVTSVCTGAFLLAKAGVITNQQVTTHWQDIAELRRLFPNLNVVEDVRWVDTGDIITSAGISAGIDMSLYIVERLFGKALADKTAKQLAFDRKEAP